MLHKVSPAATEAALMAALDALSHLRIVTPDAELVRRAVEARAAYGIHFYDGMIVAAAERAGCARILSEDFSDGQVYFGVKVANPFR
jgi:predicted nucleic acid-binding protein